MKTNISKEKIQVIFVYSVIVFLIAIIIAIGAYFFLDYQRLQSHRNDPVNKVLIEKIDKVLAKDKKDYTFDDFLDLGNSYYELKEYNRAIGVYMTALEKYPEETLFMNNLANAYIGKKDYLNAQKYYLQSIDINYQQYAIYIALANLYKEDWEGKQYTREEILLKGLEKLPNGYDLFVNLGLYYKETKNLTRAIYFFQEAIKINPDNEAIQKELDEITKK